MILLLLVFGAKRLPEMGRSLGSGMRGFKDSLSGEQTHETHERVAAIPAPGVPAAPAVPAASVTPATSAVPATSGAPSTLQGEAAVAARAVGERVPVA